MLWSKVGVLAVTLLGFFTMSAVTGLVVRVLIADGALLIAAVASILRLVTTRLPITTRLAISPCVGVRYSVVCNVTDHNEAGHITVRGRALLCCAITVLGVRACVRAHVSAHFVLLHA